MWRAVVFNAKVCGCYYAEDLLLFCYWFSLRFSNNSLWSAPRRSLLYSINNDCSPCLAHHQDNYLLLSGCATIGSIIFLPFLSPPRSLTLKLRANPLSSAVAAVRFLREYSP